MKLKVRIKLWLETENGYVLGEGLLEILNSIRELGTLRGAAKRLDMSYRHAWGIIKESEQRLGKSLLATHKGGKLGGGGAELTPEARRLIDKYLETRDALKRINKDYEIV